jgi:predicted peptidase
MNLALSIVDEVVRQFPVDRTRIYVTGRSMGGFAAWDAIARRPDFFAAAVPIAGGGDPRVAPRWKELPIWAVASAGDKSCPVSGTRVVVEALQKLDADVTYTEHPTKSHGHICQAWEDIPELKDWLFSKRKTDSEKSEPNP